MKIKFVLIIFVFISAACSAIDENKKTVKLSSGKQIEIYFEIQKHEDRGDILFIEYQNEERHLKEKTAENEVLEIWESFKEIADRSEVEEAVIKYAYLLDQDTETEKKSYGSLLYSAEKTENGTWKIIKVN